MPVYTLLLLRDLVDQPQTQRQVVPFIISRKKHRVLHHYIPKLHRDTKLLVQVTSVAFHSKREVEVETERTDPVTSFLCRRAFDA